MPTESLSRSAGSPALPTAMTIRPQLASSPATAVFTSGELAIAIAIRCADLPVTAPVTSMRISFCAPSPSRTTCSARSCSTSSSALRNGRMACLSSRSTRGCLAWPVANSSTVSLVEVSLSTVVALKLCLTPRSSMSCSSPAGSLASVNTKHSIVAMSGAIMPLPLAIPLIRTGTPPISAVRVLALGKVSVVMMPRAASSHLAGVERGVEAGQRGGEPFVRQHLADHAGAGHEHFVLRAADEAWQPPGPWPRPRPRRRGR